MTLHQTRILVTGANGFLGRYVVKELKRKGYQSILTPLSTQYDLRDLEACKKIVSQSNIVIHLAANVGGIGYNKKYPADLLYDNLIMGLNILQSAKEAKTKKLVSLGTVCSYPKYSPLPFREENLWDGYPEETTAAYGLAKKMLMVGGQMFEKQHGLHSIYLIPVNLYGPYDNFDIKRSHVISALIKKIYEAKIQNQASVSVWGTGTASREFIYVEDAARAIVLAMEKYNGKEPVNIGSGKEIFIKDLVGLIAKYIGYKGKISWDKTKPDGQPRRVLNVERAYREFGFKAQVPFSEGIQKTIQWYIKTCRKHK